MSVTVVPKEQILETPAQSLDDVLRTTVGINLPLITSYQIHPTGNSFSMRGLGGIRGLVMVDGVPINDPFFGYVQWSRVPMENIERVEVVRGASASMWGNYAMGGVVNIITRKPEQHRLRGQRRRRQLRHLPRRRLRRCRAVGRRQGQGQLQRLGHLGLQPNPAGLRADVRADVVQRLERPGRGLFRSRSDLQRQPKGQRLQREPGAAIAAADQQPAISTISPPT